MTAVLQAAFAGPLSDAFMQARGFDTLFKQAGHELISGQATVQAASAAYYPQFQASYSRLEMEANPRQTYSITQPLISVDRYATYQEAAPRDILATVTFQLREQDLCQRLFKAVAELMRTTESQRLSKAKISALKNQAMAAQKSFAAGVGTVTDQRDAQVRLDQARAEALMIEAQIDAAQRQYTSITGRPFFEEMLRLPRALRLVNLLSVDDYIRNGINSNPQLVSAIQNQRLANLAQTRANGSLWPTLSAVYTASSINQSTVSYTGVTLSMPLQASSVYQMRSAAANSDKQEEQTREIELRTRLELQRLWSLVNAGRTEIGIRMEAIQSAELSVEANEKSFIGGVRSQVDVLNSIQTYYQVQQDYVNVVLTLSENYLNLLLQAATPATEAISQVQSLLFPGH